MHPHPLKDRMKVGVTVKYASKSLRRPDDSRCSVIRLETLSETNPLRPPKKLDESQCSVTELKNTLKTYKKSSNSRCEPYPRMKHRQAKGPLVSQSVIKKTCMDLCNKIAVPYDGEGIV